MGGHCLGEVQMPRLILILSLLGLLLAAPAHADGPSRKQRMQLEDIQNAYASTIRWGNVEDAVGFLDPEQQREHPPTDFDLRRYEQVRISSYRERSRATLPDGLMERRVEVGVINNNTQAERIVTVVERWRWDPEAKRWWQTAGLPDLWNGH